MVKAIGLFKNRSRLGVGLVLLGFFLANCQVNRVRDDALAEEDAAAGQNRNDGQQLTTENTQQVYLVLDPLLKFPPENANNNQGGSVGAVPATGTNASQPFSLVSGDTNGASAAAKQRESYIVKVQLLQIIQRQLTLTAIPIAIAMGDFFIHGQGQIRLSPQDIGRGIISLNLDRNDRRLDAPVLFEIIRLEGGLPQVFLSFITVPSIINKDIHLNVATTMAMALISGDEKPLISPDAMQNLQSIVSKLSVVEEYLSTLLEPGDFVDHTLVAMLKNHVKNRLLQDNDLQNEIQAEVDLIGAKLALQVPSITSKLNDNSNGEKATAAFFQQTLPEKIGVWRSEVANDSDLTQFVEGIITERAGIVAEVALDNTNNQHKTVCNNTNSNEENCEPRVTCSTGETYDTDTNSCVNTMGDDTAMLDIAPIVVIGPPSLEKTNAGPVSFPITYQNISSVILLSQDVILHKEGNIDAQVRIEGSGDYRSVVLHQITGNGSLGISLKGGTASNAQYKLAGSAGPSEAVFVDNSPPTIQISPPSATSTMSGPVAYTLIFDDAKTIDLKVSDIQLTRMGSASGTVSISGSGSSRTVSLHNLDGKGSLGLVISAGVAIDDVGNANLQTAKSVVFQVDNSPPQVVIKEPVKTLYGGGETIAYTATYINVAAITLAPEDIILNTTGDATGTVTVESNKNNRTINIANLIGNGTITITLNPGSATGLVSGPIAGASSAQAITVDTGAPTIAVSAPSLSQTKNTAVTYTATYTDAYQISLSADLININKTGTADGVAVVTGSGNTRTITIDQITGDGTLGITIYSKSAVDTAGNKSAGSGSSDTFIVDNAPPTIAISAPSVAATNDGPVSYTLTYADATTITLVTGDIILDKTGDANGTILLSGSGNTRTVTISAITGNGSLGITVAAGTAVDGMDNHARQTLPSSVFVVDNNAPTLVLSEPSVVNTKVGPVSYTVTYTGTDTITLLDSDINLYKTGTADAGVIAISGTGTTRTVTLSSITGDGNIGIGIKQESGSDLAGNKALASPIGTAFLVDNSNPLLTSIKRTAGADNPTSNDTVQFIAVFDTPVQNVVLADFVIVPTLSATAVLQDITALSATEYMITLNTVAGSGDLRLDLNDADFNIVDSSGNGLGQSSVAGTETYTIDNEGPKLNSLVRNPSSSNPTGATTVEFIATFDEAVANVTLSDFTISKTGSANGTVTQVTATDPLTYAIKVSSITGTGTLRVDLNDYNNNIADQYGTVMAQNIVPGDESFDIDVTLPSVVSIKRAAGNPSPTNATSIDYTVLFNKDVVNVDLTDFSLTLTDTATGNLSAVVPVDAKTYTVTIDTLAGNGTLRLDLVDGDLDIEDTSAKKLSDTTVTGSEIFTIDNVLPSLVTLNRQLGSAAATSGDTVIFTATFSEAVANVAISDFELTLTGTAAGNIASVSQISTSIYDITVNTVTGDGDLRLDLNDGDADIKDLGANALINALHTGDQLVTIDNTAPSLSTINRKSGSQNPTAADNITFTVTFAESVADITPAKFKLTTTGQVTANIYAAAAVSGSVYDILVNGVSGAGTVRLDLNDNTNSIDDDADLALTNPVTIGNESFTVNTLAPSVISLMRKAGSTSPTDAATAEFSLIFSKAVTGVDSSDFELVTTGTATGNIATVTPVSALEYTILVDTLTGDGTLRLDLNDADADIVDEFSEPLVNNLFIASELFTIDNALPSITISAPTPLLSQTSDIVYTVTYADVTAMAITLGLSDLTLNKTGTADGVMAISGTGDVRAITISSISGDGTLGISIAAATATDELGHVALISGPSSVATIDNTVPVLTGLANDAVSTTSKTWSWGCDEASCKYRYVVDQLTNTAPSGAYGATITATQNTGSATYYIHVQVKDLAGNESAVVHVSAVIDQLPVLVTIGDQIVNENMAISQVNATDISGGDTDIDGNVLTYTCYYDTNVNESVGNTTLCTELTGLSFDTATGIVNWTPSYTQSGTYELKITASEGDLTDEEIFVLTITNVNRSPELNTINDQTVGEGVAITQIDASDTSGGDTDIDEQALAYTCYYDTTVDAIVASTTLSTALTGVDFNSATGVFNWTPNDLQAGNYEFKIVGSDGSLSDDEIFDITVNIGGFIFTADTTITDANVASYEGVKWTINDGVTITIDTNEVIDISTLNIPGSGTLTHAPCTTTVCRKIDLNISGNAFISSAGTIHADGKGYLGGYSGDNSSQYGRTLGNTTTGGSQLYNTGGSHGGLGGEQSVNYTANISYGDLYEPVSLGSGGGGVNGGPGGDGGGAIYLNISGTLTLDGEIRSNGTKSTYINSSGGAGGSVWIVADTIDSTTGSPKFSANGSSGGSGSTVGAGGGGRVAIYSTTMTNWTISSTTVQAWGGDAPASAADGGGGTIYYKSAAGTKGNLLLSNNNVVVGNSSYPPIGLWGTITSLSATVLETSVVLPENALIGMTVNPDKDQGVTFAITANTTNTITIGAGDMTAVSSTGKTFYVTDYATQFETITVGKGAKFNFYIFDDTSSSTITFDQNADIQVQDNFSNLVAATIALSSNSSLRTPALTCDTLSLVTGAKLIVNQVDCSTVTLSGSGTELMHYATTTSTEYNLVINATTVDVGVGSAIHADGKGYLGGYSGDNSSQYGRTLGNTTTGGSQLYNTGGSHGGLGGEQSVNYTANISYGDLYEPVSLGSGGGGVNGGPGGDGGGAIYLNISGTLTLDGEIRSNGTKSTYINSSGGAGGSVWIVADTIDSTTGSPKFSANGSSGGSGSTVGAGGGGRVAIYSTTMTNWTISSTTVQALGGIAIALGADGQDGTTFVGP